eukprot:1152698-Pelagomonas_calceolata.AAC.14
MDGLCFQCQQISPPFSPDLRQVWVGGACRVTKKRCTTHNADQACSTPPETHTGARQCVNLHRHSLLGFPFVGALREAEHRTLCIQMVSNHACGTTAQCPYWARRVALDCTFHTLRSDPATPAGAPCAACKLRRCI